MYELSPWVKYGQRTTTGADADCHTKSYTCTELTCMVYVKEENYTVYNKGRPRPA